LRLPVLEPFLVERGGQTAHPIRDRHPRLVLLSVAGFPEMAVFRQLSSWIRFVYGSSGRLVDDAKSFFETANAMWKTCIDQGLAPGELAQKLQGAVPAERSPSTGASNR
jgi:hypothetical protein